ncbi:MAG: vWA domain-containing protein [Pseudomonadota bacterium]
MRLFSPWALWLLASLPVIILMYILKQKFEERKVGSIYLWQQVLRDIEVNTPWQRLKRNLLLYLELLAVLILVFAVSDPYVNAGGRLYSNLVIVIDNTGSMNSRYGDGTRLEKARELAEEMIESSGTDANITLLTVGRSPRVELGKARDKGEAVARLRAVSPGNSSGDINDSVSLVRAIVKQYEGNSGYKAVFYTDSPVNTGDLNAEVISMSSELSNASLDYISYSEEKGKLKVLVRATNRSKEPMTREISLYGDDRVLDIRNVLLQAGKTETVYFDEIALDASYIWAEYTEEDDLLQDNRVYGVVRSAEPKKALLVSESNVFIEKALSAVKGLELYKTNPGEDIEEGFDLYIFDSDAPAKLPGSGGILLIGPVTGNGLVEVGGELEGGFADIQQHPLTRFMENAAFTVSGMKRIEAPFWADVLVKVRGNAAVLAGEYKGRKAAVIGFDLHDSDFALTTEYPIFVYNLAAYLAGMDTGENRSYLCGDSVDLNPVPEAEKLTIKDPEGRLFEPELVYPMLPFDDTDQAGIYEVIQKTAADERLSSFAVNFPVQSESTGYESVGKEAQEAQAAKVVRGGMRLRGWLIGLLLLAAAAEWVVYIRGY